MLQFDPIEKLADWFLHLTGHGGWYLLSIFMLGVTVLISVIPFFYSGEISPLKKIHPFVEKEGWYLFCVGLTILICKLPLLILHQCNPDESEWIAGAITLAKDARFWFSLDGTTSGPINFLPLLLAKLITGHLGYATAKLINFLFWILITWFTYGILKSFSKKEIARIAVLPFVLFYCLIVRQFDFGYYQSEVISMFLITGAIYLFFIYKNGSEKHLRHLIVAALLLGCIPYAKLQAVPVALFLGGWFLYQERKNGKWILVAAIFPTILCCAYLWSNHFTDDFVHSYLQNNLKYNDQNLRGIQSNSFLKSLVQFPDWSFQFRNLGLYLWIGMLTAIGILLVLYKRFREILRSNQTNLIFLSALLLISFYSVIAPKNHFHHYFLLLFIPLELFLGFTFILLLRSGENEGWKKITGLLFILLTCSSNLLQYNHFFFSMKHQAKSETSDLFTNYIRAHDKKGDQLAIWGWEPHFNVETELPQGVRDGHSYYAITSKDPYFLERFAGDLNRNLPQFFLDATGPGNFFFKKHYLYMHENFPAVNDVVLNHYELVLEKDSMRLYVLKQPL